MNVPKKDAQISHMPDNLHMNNQDYIVFVLCTYFLTGLRKDLCWAIKLSKDYHIAQVKKLRKQWTFFFPEPPNMVCVELSGLYTLREEWEIHF
jgi:hypothetical protein